MSAKCLEMLMYNTGQEKKGEQVEKRRSRGCRGNLRRRQRDFFTLQTKIIFHFLAEVSDWSDFIRSRINRREPSKKCRRLRLVSETVPNHFICLSKYL